MHQQLPKSLLPAALCVSCDITCFPKAVCVTVLQSGEHLVSLQNARLYSAVADVSRTSHSNLASHSQRSAVLDFSVKDCIPEASYQHVPCVADAKDEGSNPLFRSLLYLLYCFFTQLVGNDHDPFVDLFQ